MASNVTSNAKWRRTMAVAALSIWADPSRASTGDDTRFDATATLRLGYFHSARTLDERTGFANSIGEFKVRFELSDANRFELNARGGVYGVARTDSAALGELLNAYWLNHSEHLDLRIGQQRIAWGRADGINPTDFFTPHDYVVMLPLEEDQRLSIAAIRADFGITAQQVLQIVVQSSFRPTRLPIPPGVRIEEENDAEWTDLQTGLRYSYVGEDLEGSASIYRGLFTLPLTAPLGVDAAGPTFLHWYPRIWGAGGDVAKSIGKVGLRAEIAYIHSDDSEVRPIFQPYVFFVGGGDRSFDNWNVNLQAVVHHTPNWHDPNATLDPLERVARIQNAVLFGQSRRTEYGATARIAKNWFNETLNAELLGIFNINTHNSLVRPLLSYAVNDRQKAYLGAEYYSGPDDSYFGQLKRNRTIFFEYRMVGSF